MEVSNYSNNLSVNPKLVMRPESTRAILDFLLLSGAISRKLQRKRMRATLFDDPQPTTADSAFSEEDFERYYLPNTDCLLKLMDICR